MLSAMYTPTMAPEPRLLTSSTSGCIPLIFAYSVASDQPSFAALKARARGEVAGRVGREG